MKLLCIYDKHFHVLFINRNINSGGILATADDQAPGKHAYPEMVQVVVLDK